MKTDDEIMREFKTVRDIAYAVKKDLSDYMDTLREKEEADVAYIAMMADVDIEDETEGAEEDDA